LEKRLSSKGPIGKVRIPLEKLGKSKRKGKTVGKIARDISDLERSYLPGFNRVETNKRSAGKGAFEKNCSMTSSREKIGA